MVADGVHVLLGPALVMLLFRSGRAEPYLVAMLSAGLPDLDRFLFGPLIDWGYLAGPLWAHRGITHSLLVMALFVGLAHQVDEARAGAIGYGSHLAADFLTGNVRLFAPFDVTAYGLGYDWLLGSAVAGGFSSVVLVVGVVAMARRERVDRLRRGVRGRVPVPEWATSRRRVSEAAPDAPTADPSEQELDR
jgi:inner membrane protein